jgi:hypothetical protein
LAFLGIVTLALVVVVSQSGGGKAAQATVTQSCPAGEDGGVTVSFVWPAPATGATETWLDIGYAAKLPDGSYQGYGPFDPAQTAYAIAGLPAGVTYYYRVQSKLADGWRTDASGSFVSSCGRAAVPGVVTPRCYEGPAPGPSDDAVAAALSWLPGSPGEQWVDLTVAGEAFAPGAYQGYGPVASGGASYEVLGLARGVTYWWRVNTRTPGGWLTSGVGQFATPGC